MPFIFANFNGTQHDVEVVTHEAGHAFAAYMNRDRIPYSYVWPSMEAARAWVITKCRLFLPTSTAPSTTSRS